MLGRALPHKLARNVEAIVVFVASAALLIWVPERYFLETAMAMLVSAIVVIWLIKKYLDRLHASMAKLRSSGRDDEVTALKTREFLVIDFAILFAVAGLVAFFALIFVYGD